jgi:hypothetical protein
METMSETPTIAQALAAVMRDIDHVGKTDRNQAQGFDFRGVDAVVNAVGPALRKHGVIMVPHAGIPIENSYDTRSGTRMTRVVLPVTFSFHGPAGDVIDCHVYGESSDAGDKVMSKAHSVAWRVAMLQVFAIPTDDPDPDATSHEQAVVEFDWAGLGWADQADHDAALEQCRAVARRLPDPHRENVKDWIHEEGWVLPYTRTQMDDWATMMETLTKPTASRPVEDTADPTAEPLPGVDGVDAF